MYISICIAIIIVIIIVNIIGYTTISIIVCITIIAQKELITIQETQAQRSDTTNYWAQGVLGFLFML